MRIKSLFVLYDENDWGAATPLLNSPETRRSFEEFYTIANAQSIQVYRANIDWYNTQSKAFEKAWTFKHGNWIKVKNPPKPDAFLDKVAGKHNHQYFSKKIEMSHFKPFVNDPTFRTFFDNKLHQYIAFGAHMAPSHFASNKNQFLHVLKKIKSDRVVVKLLYGSGGKEVTIANKSKMRYIKFDFPVLVQEFIPTAGIPGFSNKKEVADLRLVFINHELIYALSRKAKGKSLFTNFHQGASAILVPKNRIPLECLAVTKEIQKKIKQFEKAHYSLDFLFSQKGKPVFIEINTTPGFDLLRLVGSKKIREQHAKKLLDLFI